MFIQEINIVQLMALVVLMIQSRTIFFKLLMNLLQMFMLGGAKAQEEMTDCDA